MSDEQYPSDEIISYDYSADGGPADGKQELQRGWDMLVVQYGEPEPCRECSGARSRGKHEIRNSKHEINSKAEGGND